MTLAMRRGRTRAAGLVLLLALLASGCGAAGSADDFAGGGGGGGGGTGVATVSWDPPTANSDGSTPADVDGYIIYYGPGSGGYTALVNVGNVTEASVGGLPSGRTYFAVAAYSSTGAQSALSEEAFKDIP